LSRRKGGHPTLFVATECRRKTAPISPKDLSIVFFFFKEVTIRVG
jgi:hypothetical protein